MRSGFPDLMYEQAKQSDLLEIPADGISLDLLRAVYRNPSIPLSVRIRCAVAALPFETPKLGTTAHVAEQDFATMLERRLQRISETKLIEARPTDEKVDVRLAPPIPDRRFRRI
jgi:hypothetical protein